MTEISFPPYWAWAKFHKKLCQADGKGLNRLIPPGEGVGYVCHVGPKSPN